MLRDDKGNYLPVLETGGTVGSSFERLSNSFEFMGAGLDTKSITLIPRIASGAAHKVSGALDSMPLTDDSTNGFTLESLEMGDRQATATFSFRGAVSVGHVNFTLQLADGTLLDHVTDCFIDYTYDRENGLCVTTIEYPNATDEQVAQITGVVFAQPDDDLELLEDQAVTINLQ